MNCKVCLKEIDDDVYCEVCGDRLVEWGGPHDLVCPSCPLDVIPIGGPRPTPPAAA